MLGVAISWFAELKGVRAGHAVLDTGLVSKCLDVHPLRRVKAEEGLEDGYKFRIRRVGHRDQIFDVLGGAVEAFEVVDNRILVIFS